MRIYLIPSREPGSSLAAWDGVWDQTVLKFLQNWIWRLYSVIWRLYEWIWLRPTRWSKKGAWQVSHGRPQQIGEDCCLTTGHGHWYTNNQGCHGTGKTGNLKVHFSRQGKHRKFAKNIKKMFLHREFTTNTGKFLRVKKKKNLQFIWMKLPSSFVIPGSWSVSFWLLFHKLLRGLLKWIYSGLYSSLGKERMAMVVMEAIYKLKLLFVD